MPTATATATATASARATAFRSPPLDLEPTPWSGRVSQADLQRPGGLLIAALLQCAAERGLSLSELATAMGANYWNLGQLRVGFRRIEALDNDLADACAAYLDLPRLTIELLAGLVTPEQALLEEDLSGEDILHARQLLACEPAELLLLPPPNRARPLQSLSVDELAGLQRAYGSNPAVAGALRAELGARPMSKTELLRAALAPAPETHARAEADAPAEAPADTQREPPPHGILRCACCQKRLRVPHLSEPGEIRCPGCQTEYAVCWQDKVCLIERMAAPEDSAEAGAEDEEPDEAPAAEASAAATCPWAVLGLPRQSGWDAVERARRALLQQYHPDRLGHVPPLVRQLAEEAFKRVSEAYDTLKARRR